MTATPPSYPTHRNNPSPTALDTPQAVYASALQVARTAFVRGHDTQEVRTLRNRYSMALPMILDDGDPATVADRILRESIVAAIGEIEDNLTREGLVRGEPAFNRRLAVKLEAFLRRPESEGGLGVVSLGSPAIEVEPYTFLGRQIVTCHGFAALYYGAALLAGLEPAFFEERSEGLEYHSFVGIRYDRSDPDRIVFADPLYSDPIENTARWSTGVVYELTPLDFLAAYHLNRAMLNYRTEGDPERRARLERGELLTALRYTPNNYSVLFTFGQWLSEHPEAEGNSGARASELLRRAQVLSNSHRP